MKALFIGGIKSGKSLNAETYILKLTKNKPLYLATTEFFDEGMKKRVREHQKQRAHNFMTHEEGVHIYEVIKNHEGAVLVECVSMWINNMLYHQKNYEQIQEEIANILALDKDIVFVLNDVGGGVIPENALAREFVDISGKVSQQIAQGCDEVFHCIASIATKIK